MNTLVFFCFLFYFFSVQYIFTQIPLLQLSTVIVNNGITFTNTKNRIKVCYVLNKKYSFFLNLFK